MSFPLIGDLPIDTWKGFAERGVMFEFAYQNVKKLPRIKRPRTVAELVEGIRRVGVDSAVFSTNYGGPSLPPPHEGLLEGLAALSDEGLTPAEIRKLVHDNPRRALAVNS